MARDDGGRVSRKRFAAVRCAILSLVAAAMLVTVFAGAVAAAARNPTQTTQARVRKAILRMKAAHHADTNPHEHLARARDLRAKKREKSVSKKKECVIGDTNCNGNDKPPQNRSNIVELESRRGMNETLTALDASLLAEDATLIAALPINLTSVAERVRQATVEAWTAYKDHAWGKDELVPRGCSWENVYGGQGVTIIDAMSTLLLMDLNKEYDEAAQWVKHELVYDKLLPRPISTFETIIRSLGGLLSAFETTDDCGLLDKAADLGARVLDTFSNQTALLAGKMRITGEPFENAVHRSPRGLHAPVSALAEIGTFSLEFAALAYHTGDTSYIARLDAAMDVIERTKMENGLFPLVFHSSRLRGVEELSSIGAKGDSYYEYLLKRWIHSEVSSSVDDGGHHDDNEADAGGQRQTRYLRKWIAAMDNIIELMVKSNEEGYMYIGDYHDGSVLPRMEHLSCFVPGMLALGVTYANMVDDDVMGSKRKETYMDVARGVAKTCFAMYVTSGSKGLSPEFVYLHPKMSVGATGRPYLLRPEAIESFYHLYVSTGDEVYRAYAYHIFSNILRHHEETDTVPSGEGDEKICGFSVVNDVTDDPNPAPATFKAMPSYFISETLKYLYLLFDDSPASQAMSSGEFVFNTEGHPLRQLTSVTRDDATHPCKGGQVAANAKSASDDVDNEHNEHNEIDMDAISSVTDKDQFDEVHEEEEAATIDAREMDDESHLTDSHDEPVEHKPSVDDANVSPPPAATEDIEIEEPTNAATSDADDTRFDDDIHKEGDEHTNLHVDEAIDDAHLTDVNTDASGLLIEEPLADTVETEKDTDAESNTNAVDNDFDDTYYNDGDDLDDDDFDGADFDDLDVDGTSSPANDL